MPLSECLRPGDRITVAGSAGGTIYGFATFISSVVETTFVCYSNYVDANEYVMVLYDHGHVLSDYMDDENIPDEYRNMIGYRIPLVNVKELISQLKPRKPRKPISVVCRGCGSKFPWNKGTSKRNYVCLPCRID